MLKICSNCSRLDMQDIDIFGIDHKTLKKVFCFCKDQKLNFTLLPLGDSFILCEKKDILDTATP